MGSSLGTCGCVPDQDYLHVKFGIRQGVVQVLLQQEKEMKCLVEAGEGGMLQCLG